MPRIGIFKSNIYLGILGKLLLVTVDGPPDKIIPFISEKLWMGFNLIKYKDLSICGEIKFNLNTFLKGNFVPWYKFNCEFL